MEEHILCYKKSGIGNEWTCNRGFASFIDADAEASKMLSHHTDFQTKIVSANSYTPNFIQERMIQYKLSPRVLLKDRSDTYHK